MPYLRATRTYDCICLRLSDISTWVVQPLRSISARFNAVRSSSSSSLRSSMSTIGRSSERLGIEGSSVCTEANEFSSMNPRVIVPAALCVWPEMKPASRIWPSATIASRLVLRGRTSAMRSSLMTTS